MEIQALRWQLSGSFRRFSGKYYAFDSSIAILKPPLSLSTIHREYAALVSLPYYDYVDMILRPQLPMPPQVDPRDAEIAMAKYSINEPQANAILSSLDMSGFSLIQG
jgi:senataxin